jgi:hypothetical protein
VVLSSILPEHVLAERDKSASAFKQARPFPHVVFDGFLHQQICDALVAEFPSFEHGNALTEDGRLGGKSVFESIRELGPAFRMFDDALQSRAFLDFIGEITGIPQLLYDPEYIGGGTHENRPPQSLNPHIDFNFHPRRGWHRRLNLILYLNPEWEEGWGGALELHTDPWRPRSENPIKTVLPVKNRCVIFETSEVSWHGFPEISLPKTHAALTRRSIAVYLYTEDRPADQTAAAHSTVYVERPLSDAICAGTKLNANDVREIEELLQRRRAHLERLFRRENELTRSLADRLQLERLVSTGEPLSHDASDTLRWLVAREDEHLRYFYEREKQFSDRIEHLDELARSRFPITGLELQSDVCGYWPDQWATTQLTFRCRALRRTTGLSIAGHIPRQLGRQDLTLTVGQVESTYSSRWGWFEWRTSVPLDPTVTVTLTVSAARSWRPSQSSSSPDRRDLAWFVRYISAT